MGLQGAMYRWPNETLTPEGRRYSDARGASVRHQGHGPFEYKEATGPFENNEATIIYNETETAIYNETATAIYNEAEGRLQRGRWPSSTTRPLAVYYNEATAVYKEAAGRLLQRGRGPSTTRPLAVVYNEATAVYNEAARADHTTTTRPREPTARQQRGRESRPHDNNKAAGL